MGARRLGFVLCSAVRKRRLRLGTVRRAVKAVDVAAAGVVVRVRARDAAFLEQVARRFDGRGAAIEEVLGPDRDVRLTLRGTRAVLGMRGLEGEVDLKGPAITTPPNLVFADTLVRAAVAWRLAEEGALLLHASAVRRSGNAVVFFGASGAGKSTVARAIGNALADELVQVRRRGNAWIVRGTPWWGSSAESAPLDRLVWLVRGEIPSVRRAGGRELFLALSREAGRYFPEPGFQRRLFEMCADLATLGAVRVAAAEGRVAEDVAEVLG